MRINNYIRNKMSPEEARAFKIEMENNPDLAAEYEMVTLEIDMMEHLLKLDLSEQIKSWKRKIPKTENGHKEKVVDFKKNTARKWYIFAAAAATIIIIISSVLNLLMSPIEKLIVQDEFKKEIGDSIQIENPKETIAESPNYKTTKEKAVKKKKKLKKNTQKLAKPQIHKIELEKENQYYAMVDDFSSSESIEIRGNVDNRSPNGNPTDTLSLAIQALNSNNNKKTIALLESFLHKKSREKNEVAVKTLAYAYFNNKNYDKAENIFENLIKNQVVMIDELEWYLLLCKIAQLPRNKDSCLELLHKITSDDLHNYQQKAISINKALDKIKK